MYITTALGYSLAFAALATALPSRAIDLLTATPAQPAAAASGTISAIGIGVANLQASQTFYASVFGYGTGSTLSFPNWDEIIMMPPKGGLGPALIPMVFKPLRPTKDLPVRMTLSVPDVKLALEKAVKAGGVAVQGGNGTGVAVRVRDVDGYILELTPGAGTGLLSVGYASTNPARSAAFFASLAGTSPKSNFTSLITVPTKRPTGLQFFQAESGQNTKRLPHKIVFSVANMNDFKKTITDGGGTLLDTGLLAALVGMANDPVDGILVEINSGGKG